MVERKTASKKGLTPRQWVKIRKISQLVFLAGFLVIFLWSRREFYLNPSLESGFKEKLVNLPLKLDPLVMIAQSLASRKVLVGSLLAIITLVISALVGRVWCGWFCPMGTVLDWFPLRTWKKNKPAVPERYRGIKYILLMVILFAAGLGNLSLLIFDPLTIGYRTLTTAIWPGLDQLVTGIEVFLFKIPLLSSLVGGFDSLVRPAIFPPHPAAYRYGWLYMGFFMVLIGLNAVSPRFWCRYLCPLGGIFGLFGKVSLIHCEISSDCTQCGMCIPACPTGAIQENEGVFCDPGECTMCLICKADCPGGKVHFPIRTTQFIHQPYDINRKKALLSFGTAVIGVGLLDTQWIDQKQSDFLIRPPGVINDQLLSTCIRCGECSTVCPTNAIQMAVWEGGVEGFWTPVLVLRNGYCDYSCQACGQVCPVEAIPPLTLEEKRKQIIGKAEIDRTRCLPWTENQECIVCEEMCPIPDKAIRLEEIQVTSPGGEVKILQRPHVIRRECIGCGICETKCPLTGEAAIRIRIHSGRQHENQYRGR